MTTTRAPRPVVLKFGGAALQDVGRIADRVRVSRNRGVPVVIVASARAGVTNLLEQILAAPQSARRHQRLVRAIIALHPENSSSADERFGALEELVREVERAYPHDRPLGDRLLSEGERLSVHWLSERLRELGIPALAVEADHLGLTTDNAYGASVILLDRSRRPVRTGLGRLLKRGQVPVVTGYFGRSLEGRVATLGRGGSDYSASAIGAILGARAVELVKQGVAVQTADPKLVPSARLVRRLSYEEAEELSQFGARVLHPMTIDPARRASLELRVRSLEDPRRVTIIGPASSRGGVRALTLLSPLRLVRVRVPGGRQRPGVVAEISRRLARESVNIVALYTSSALLAIVVDPREAKRTIRALRPMTGSGPAAVEGPIAVDLLTVIGDHVIDDLGSIPGWVLAAAGGLSATPRSLSLAIPSPVSLRALRAAHHTLVDRRR